MPAYGTQTPPPSLGFNYPLNQVSVFQAETLIDGEFSERVCIPLGPTSGVRGIRIEGDFSANPGAFEIDVMECDDDSLGKNEYQQVPTGGVINTVTTGANGANTHFSTNLIPIAGQFACLYVKTHPANAVTCTARITRCA